MAGLSWGRGSGTDGSFWAAKVNNKKKEVDLFNISIQREEYAHIRRSVTNSQIKPIQS